MATSIDFTKEKLLPLFPEMQIAIDLYDTYKSNLENLQTNIDTSPFDEVYGFLCMVIGISACLNNLGLTGDIRQKNVSKQKIDVQREFYIDEFPPSIYAYAPIKRQVKTITYYSKVDKITSNEIEANKIVTTLYNVDFPDVIKDTIATSYHYEITPPVAILQNENESVTKTLLIAPNMDTNYVQIHRYSKWLYYPLSTFQPSILQHALAYFFIKNHDFSSAIILLNLSTPVTFISTILRNLKLSTDEKNNLTSMFVYAYDLAKSSGELINGVISSINNVTGNRAKVDPRNTVMLIAAILNEPTIIQQIADGRKVYDLVREQLPNSGKISEVTTQITHNSYTPAGEHTIVSRMVTSLTSHGQRCSTTQTVKISRSSSIQVIPLLRSRVMAKDGEYVMIELDKDQKAKLVNQQELGVTDD